MHPRFPLRGKHDLFFNRHSSPNSTAGGPFWHEPLHGELGTQGSLLAAAPEAIVDLGMAHAGGAAGSGNADCGKTPLKPGRCKHPPSPPRQRKHAQFSPGSASVVLAGRGENKREPVGSIAGKRSRLHPLEMATNKTMAMTNNRPMGSDG